MLLLWLMEINTAVRMMNVTIYKYGNLQIYR